MEKIEQVSIELLIPYANNARTHSDAQVAQIAASIRKFGFTNPVLTSDDNTIIAGHGRVMAARKLGLTQVPVIRLSHLSETQRKAYILADNKLALNAGWDDDLLRIEIKELLENQFQIDLLGFDVEEITRLMDEEISLHEPEEQKYSEVFNIIVECKNEQEQERVFNELDEKGYKCRVQSL